MGMAAGAGLAEIESKSQTTTFLALSVLGDLIHTGNRKCVCHIAGSLKVPEKKLYPLLEDLLVEGLVEISLPKKQVDHFSQIPDDELDDWELSIKKNEKEKAKNAIKLEAILKTNEQLSEKHEFGGKKGNWRKFFKKIGKSETAPRYYIVITPKGKKHFKSNIGSYET